MESKLKSGYKCIYEDGTVETLSPSVVRNRLLPTAEEVRGEASAPSFFGGYRTPSPVKRKRPASRSASRRSSRKRKSVAVASPPPAQIPSAPFPFLYMTIPVDGWIVEAGSVIDTRFGFGVVKEVRTSVATNLCDYVVDLPFGELTLSSTQETLYQVATLEEVDGINAVLLEKSAERDVKDYISQLSPADVETLGLQQRRKDLESSVRYKPLAKEGDRVLWELDGVCVYENEAEGDRCTNKADVLKRVKMFHGSDKLSCRVVGMLLAALYAFAN